MDSNEGPESEPSRDAPTSGGSRRWAVVAAVVLAIAAAAFLLARARAPRTNVLLITLDTTRADRLGCYGHPLARTPNLDRLAKEGARFEAASSAVPLTLPAHSTIFTGLYPFAHGVRNNGNFFLDPKHETMAGIFKKRGYRTAAFVSAFVLDDRYGLARDFETYDDRPDRPTRQVVNFEAQRRGDHTAQAAIDWLDAYAAEPSRPFFLWLHLYDPHEPYQPPPPFDQEFKNRPYDGEIAFTDSVVGTLVQALARHGWADRTLVVVVGDHGEGLREHGEEAHAMFVYETVLHVPFIVRRPGAAGPGTIVRDPVTIADVAPTILDLVGAPPLAGTHGRSLAPLLDGRRLERPFPVYAESYWPKLYFAWAPLRAVRDERWKYIDAPKPELYDLAEDPKELVNLYERDTRRGQAMKRELDRLTGGGEGVMASGTTDREAMEKLAALGYVGAGDAPEARAGETLPDPKDKLESYNRLRQANVALQARRFDEAFAILDEVLAAEPENAFALAVQTTAHMQTGDFAAAEAALRKQLALVPTSPQTHHRLAVCLLRQKKADEALKETEATLAVDPRFGDARVLRAEILAARREWDQAVAELRTAIESDPGKALLHHGLGTVLFQANRPGEAEAAHAKAVELKPDFAQAYAGRGAALAGVGRLDEAVASYRTALEIEPRLAEARFNLGEVLEGENKPEQALVEYRRLADSPQTPPAIREAAGKKVAGLGGEKPVEVGNGAGRRPEPPPRERKP